jgi:cyclase
VKTAKIERVADGVFAAIAEEGGVAVGNAGFVDLGGETLVFDTHVSLTAARALRRAAEEHAPVSDVVLSHWHPDHVYGAAAFDARVVAALRQAAPGDPNPFPQLPSPEMWERNLLNS